MSASDNGKLQVQQRSRTPKEVQYPRVFIVQLETGGRIRLQGDEDVMADFLARCRARGLTLHLFYLSYCG